VDIYTTLGIVVLLGVGMYFLMIRPAKKQQQKQQALMNSLEPGSRVMLGSGIYGTIRHLGDKQAVIEISPGVDLTVLRAAIRGVVGPDEEEFEYASDGEPAPVDSTMDAFEADLANPGTTVPPVDPADGIGTPPATTDPGTDPAAGDKE